MDGVPIDFPAPTGRDADNCLDQIELCVKSGNSEGDCGDVGEKGFGARGLVGVDFGAEILVQRFQRRVVRCNVVTEQFAVGGRVFCVAEQQRRDPGSENRVCSLRFPSAQSAGCRSVEITAHPNIRAAEPRDRRRRQGAQRVRDCDLGETVAEPSAQATARQRQQNSPAPPCI